MLFLPCHIMLLTKRVTSLSLKRGSGAKGIFLGCVLRMISYFVEAQAPQFKYLFLVCKLKSLLFNFCLLGTVLGTALFPVFHTGSIKATANNVITHTR